jgi:hypothetical protein
VVDPLVQAVHAARPDRAADFTLQVYAVALELAALRLIGPGARQTTVAAAWQRTLPPAAALIAAAPRRALAAVSNAAYALAVTPGARVDAWLTRMATLAPLTSDLETWLKLGQIAAWREGLAHFRPGALALADQVPAALALQAVGASPGSAWPEVRPRLLASPWAELSPATNAANVLRVAARAGSFRGFGGLFPHPPRVATLHEHFLVQSGSESWLLTADAWGATFHRADPAEQAIAGSAQLTAAGVRAEGNSVVAGAARLALADLGAITSLAANAHTIAVTGELTHAVVLLARPAAA